MRRIALLIVSALLLTLTGCGKFTQIEVNSVKVEKICPYGLSGVEAGLAVEINNPAVQIKLSDMEAVVRYCGKVLGNVTVDPFTMKGRTVETYHLDGRLVLDKEVSFYDLLMFLDKDFAENCVLDITAKGKLRGGLSKKITKKDVPLKKLMKYADKKK